MVYAGSYSVLWLRANVPDRLYYKSEILLLITAEISCAITAGLSVLGILVLGGLLLQRRRIRERRLSPLAD